ncbi:hypothetical protein EIN_173950 [Entamoeba invadens IP1]|uniref:Uncharacterized protein n=1 Tax=Entamoeba invadens IP1 TaxID=370355 RepID=A0A0A1TYS1_ENTIV|nr:hypothetical protein EIN_173950 [Entamoeba invadens IP1]ELP84720.1 hypothetical protein EIN_173950 [Entamoeba invadens IP1]|eukprot:XP_004184066.1 hypothetical protein EIN_173950 [Entamoeba invadens IP1]
MYSKNSESMSFEGEEWEGKEVKVQNKIKRITVCECNPIFVGIEFIEELYLLGCNCDMLGVSQNLTTLSVSDLLITHLVLPPTLKNLEIENLSGLNEIDFGVDSKLTHFTISKAGLNQLDLPSSLKELEIGECFRLSSLDISSLTKLYLFECTKLTFLQNSSTMESLSLFDCPLATFPEFSNLKTLFLQNVSSPQINLPHSLTQLEAVDCPFTRLESIENCNLVSLDLFDCKVGKIRVPTTITSLKIQYCSNIEIVNMNELRPNHTLFS